MLVAGVDSSTQGCKIVIVNALTGGIVRQGRAPHPAGTEIDPEYWWQALHKSVEDAGGIRDISAIAVSGQQHGLVALDKHGNVIRPALLWNDTRSAPSAAALIKEAGGPEVYAKKVGIVPVASFTASKSRWLRDAEPENAKRVAAVALPHDWLTWRLRGYGPGNPDLDKLVTDRSDASGTAYWSGETNRYVPESFEHAFGRPMREASNDYQGTTLLNEAILGCSNMKTTPDESTVIVPRVLAPHERAGYVSPHAIPVEGKVVVGPGTGDNAGGALGLGLTGGDVVVSLGTSGAAFASLEGNLGNGDPTGVVAGFSSASGGHSPLVCTLNGARILEAGVRLLRLSEGPAALAPLALAAQPGSGGLVLLPYFEGERTPNLPTAKASLHNLTLENSSPENLARASIESLMCSMAQAINAIHAVGSKSHTSFFHRHKPRRALLIGGASVNPAVQDIAASVFDVDVILVPAPSEYVAKGAAFQAAWVLSGKKPEWKSPSTREIPCKNLPHVSQQYEAIQKAQYPQLR